MIGLNGIKPIWIGYMHLNRNLQLSETKIQKRIQIPKIYNVIYFVVEVFVLSLI